MTFFRYKPWELTYALGKVSLLIILLFVSVNGKLGSLVVINNLPLILKLFAPIIFIVEMLSTSLGVVALLDSVALLPMIVILFWVITHSSLSVFNRLKYMEFGASIILSPVLSAWSIRLNADVSSFSLSP